MSKSKLPTVAASTDNIFIGFQSSVNLLFFDRNSLNELNKSLALENLSMGMSADYVDAVKNGSTFVRVGSSIFGSRS